MNFDFNAIDKVIQTYEPDRGDKLAVIDHPQKLSSAEKILIFTEGGFSQAFERASLDSKVGGYNNEAVADYFEDIAGKFFQDIQKMVESNESPIDYNVEFKGDERRLLRNRIAHFKAIMEELSPECDRFTQLHKRFFSQLKKLNVYFGLMENENAIVDDSVYLPEINPSEAEIKIKGIVSANLSFPVKAFLYALQKIKYIFLPLAVLPRLNSKATITPYSWWCKNVELKTWDLNQELKLEKKVKNLSEALLDYPVLTQQHARVYKMIVESGLDSRRNFNLTFDSEGMDIAIYKKIIEIAATNPRCDTITLDHLIDGSEMQNLREKICQHGFQALSTIRYHREISEPPIYNALRLVDLCFAVGIAAFGVWLYNKKKS